MIWGGLGGFFGAFAGGFSGAVLIPLPLWHSISEQVLGGAVLAGALGGILGVGLRSTRRPKLNGYHFCTGLIGAALAAGIYIYVGTIAYMEYAGTPAYSQIAWNLVPYLSIGAGIGGGVGSYLGYCISRKISPPITVFPQNEYYTVHYQLMRESMEKMQSFRHDIKNHLSTLKTYSTQGNQEEILSYLNILLEDVNESELYSNTGNIAVDSIVNYKLKDAKRDGIELELNIFIPPTIDIETVDIVTILGNLLDNALEAVAKVQLKKIKLNIALDNGALLIKVENSFNGDVKYFNKMHERQIISSKSRPGNGLQNIKRTIDKYSGYVEITHSNNTFYVRILLSFAG